MSKSKPAAAFTRSFALPTTATLGSALRAKGLLQELRARLGGKAHRALALDGMALTLSMGEEDEDAFSALETRLAALLPPLDSLPVLPREIEDILTITTSERRRWLEDGRLVSAGTRTIRLRGRAKAITFHVFDPRQVEALLDQGTVDTWREDDVLAREENRQKAAERRRLTKRVKASRDESINRERSPANDLKGFEQFFKDGLLR